MKTRIVLLLSLFSTAATYNVSLQPGDTLTITVAGCPACPSNTPPVTTGTTVWNVVFDGDSHTTFNGADSDRSSTGCCTACCDVADLVAQRHSNWIVQNFAVSGQSIAQMNADAASQIDGAFNSAAAVNIVFFNPGGADWIAHGGRDWNMWQQVCTYVAARRARGWTVVLATPPNSKQQYANQQSDGWTNYTSMVRANWNDIAHGFCDLAADSRAQNYLDLTWYNTDQTHLNPSGVSVYADLANDAIVTAGNKKIAGQQGRSLLDIPGLIRWHKPRHNLFFNGFVTNLVDSSGFQRNMVNSTGAPFYTPTFVDFNGGVSMISGDDGALDNRSQLTISIWVKLNSYTQPATAFISNLDPYNRGFFLGTFDASGDVIATAKNGNVMSYINTTSHAATLGVWHHYVSVFDSGTLKVYIDGILQPTTAGGPLPTISGNSSSLLRLGEFDGGLWRLNGSVDNIAIWSGALNQATVSYLYSLGR